MTGASRGIGDGIARRLASEGARVPVSARTVEPDQYAGLLQETLADITAAGGEASPSGPTSRRPRIGSATLEQFSRARSRVSAPGSHVRG